MGAHSTADGNFAGKAEACVGKYLGGENMLHSLQESKTSERPEEEESPVGGQRHRSAYCHFCDFWTFSPRIRLG